MANTIETVPHEDCTGCGACLNACPKAAISMRLDGDFPYPMIDHDLCVNCGICERSCPVLHPSFENAEQPACYAYWAADDVRAKSSSGGAFTVLAEHITAQGGVVAGAAYADDCYSVEYRIAETSEGLAPLRGSKYVQADTGHVYQEVKRALDAGRPALFVGCPCEVAGMKSFLRKDYQNLYIVDLVCHGVPPQTLFERFVREEEAAHGSKAIRVSFRDKSFVPWNVSTSIDFANGEQYRKRRNECPYLKAFLYSMMFRESCGHCKFATLPRQGDLTLADFWDVHLLDPKLDDRKGTSLVLVNNEKGSELLETLRASAKLLEPASLGHGIEHNRQIAYSSVHNPKRERFQSLMRDYDYSFEKAAAYALEDRYDVGFVGWWYGQNYGSNLTSFALNRVLVGMGRTVLMLDWPMGPAQGEGARGRRFGRHFYDIPDYVPLERTHEFNARCDMFVVGSDQLWNWWSNRDVNTTYFFCDWADDAHKKIAYSTSFGHESAHYPYDLRFRVGYLLSRFDSISVRETSAVETCRHDFGLDDVEQTMDPVFLCPMGDYEQAMALSELDDDSPYVLGYIMNPTAGKRDAVRKVAAELGLPYKILVDGQGDFEELKRELDDDHLMSGVETADWLWLFRHASYVVTDSFHGFCFSLIFKKQLSIFINPLRGRARIDSLASIAGVEDRVFDTYEQFLDGENWANQIDYSRVNARLEPEVERSRAWLKTALDTPKKQPSMAEVRCREIMRLQKRVDELERTKATRPSAFLRRKLSRIANVARRGMRAVRSRGLRYALGRLKEKIRGRLRA